MSQSTAVKSEWRPWLLCGIALVFAFMLESCCGCGPLLLRKNEASDKRIEKSDIAVVKDLQKRSSQTSPVATK